MHPKKPFPKAHKPGDGPPPPSGAGVSFLKCKRSYSVDDLTEPSVEVEQEFVDLFEERKHSILSVIGLFGQNLADTPLLKKLNISQMGEVGRLFQDYLADDIRLRKNVTTALGQACNVDELTQKDFLVWAKANMPAYTVDPRPALENRLNLLMNWTGPGLTPPRSGNYFNGGTALPTFSIKTQLAQARAANAFWLAAMDRMEASIKALTDYTDWQARAEKVLAAKAWDLLRTEQGGRAKPLSALEVAEGIHIFVDQLPYSDAKNVVSVLRRQITQADCQVIQIDV